MVAPGISANEIAPISSACANALTRANVFQNAGILVSSGSIVNLARLTEPLGNRRADLPAPSHNLRKPEQTRRASRMKQQRQLRPSEENVGESKHGSAEEISGGGMSDNPMALTT